MSMKKLNSKITLLTILFVVCSINNSFAQQVDLNYQYLKEVGLDTDSFDKYDRLINVKGLVEKTIKDDPILVLGLYADDDAERKKYAKLYMDREVKRADRMFQFISIYQELYDKEFSTKPMLDMSGFKAPPKKRNYSNQRLVVFFDINCFECKKIAKNLQAKVNEGNILGLDLYFTGIKDLAEIKSWAKEAELDIDLVMKNKIALNSGVKLAKELGLKDTSTKYFLRQGDKLLLLEISSLLDIL